MQVKKTTLRNGLRVLTIPFENMESATVTIWTAVGSRHETKEINGISHFLEHMVFKGSIKRPSAKDIAEAVDAMGAEFNAGTTKEWTNFYIKSRAALVPQAFDVLGDMVLNPILRSEDIDREKGVIIEEISMYEDTPSWRVSDLFEQLMFKGNTLGWDIIGTRDTVKSITQQDFEKYRTLHYHSNNIVVTVSGGIDEEKVIALAEEYFGSLKTAPLSTKPESFTQVQTKPQVLVSNQKKEQAHLILGFLGHKRGDKSRFVEGVLASILGGGMSSRLFTEIREKRGLAYSVRTQAEHFEDTGYIQTQAGVDLKRVDEAIEIIMDQCVGLSEKKYPITTEELARAKEFVKGHLALSLEDTRNINHFFGEEELLMGKTITPEQVYEAVDAVSEEDIVTLAKKLFTKDKLNLALIGPYEDPLRFEKLLR